MMPPPGSCLPCMNAMGSRGNALFMSGSGRPTLAASIWPHAVAFTCSSAHAMSKQRYGPTSLHAVSGTSVAATATGTRTPAAKAAIFTGTYATIAGLALVIAPATAFGLLFNAAEVTTGWIRVGGILFALIGMQYLGTGLGDSQVLPSGTTDPAQATAGSARIAPLQQAQQGPPGGLSGQAAVGATRPFLYSRSFYTSTIWSRMFLCTGFTLLVCGGQSPPALLVLAAFNCLGAFSMWLAVRKTDSLLSCIPQLA